MDRLLVTSDCLNCSIGAVCGVLCREQVDTHQVVPTALLIRRVAAKERRSLDVTLPFHNAIWAQIPTRCVVGDRTIIEVQEGGVFDVGSVSGPQIHPVTSIQNIEVRGQVIPKFSIALIVDGSRTVQAIDFPITTPVSGGSDIFREPAKNIVVVSRKAE